MSTSLTHTRKNQSAAPTPHSGVNDNGGLQEVSILVAGKIAPHLGSFIQTTYSGSEHKLALDQVDVRYTRVAKIGSHDGVIGLDFNNNPTIQDVFNTLSTFSFPYISSDLAPSLSASPLISGGLSKKVAGVSGYIYWNNNIYAELGGYTSLGHKLLGSLGVADDAGKLDGVAPYWRLAYTKDMGTQSASLGFIGMHAKLLPGRQSGPSNSYTDYGFDGSYQYIGDEKNIISFNTAYIIEMQNLNFSVFNGDTNRHHQELNQFTADMSWYHHDTYGLTLGIFSTTGTTDSSLYTPQQDSGSRTGTPDTRGYRIQADYTPFGKDGSWHSPWVNVRFGIQYTGYTKFNGAKFDYDGFGRNSADNNTLYMFAWFAY